MVAENSGLARLERVLEPAAAAALAVRDSPTAPTSSPWPPVIKSWCGGTAAAWMPHSAAGDASAVEAGGGGPHRGPSALDLGVKDPASARQAAMSAGMEAML
jgi:hypothetical protein